MLQPQTTDCLLQPRIVAVWLLPETHYWAACHHIPQFAAHPATVPDLAFRRDAEAAPSPQ